MSIEEDKRKNQNPSEHPLRWNPRFVLLVVGTILVTSLFGFVLVLLDKEATEHQHRMAALLVCFVLAVTFGLLFSIRASVHGNLPVFGAYFSVGGPAAFFLLAYALTHFTLSGTPHFPETASRFLTLLADFEQKDGWINFERWKNRLGSLHWLFEENAAETNQRIVLSGAYIAGGEQLKFRSPTIETLFLYAADDPSSESCRQFTAKFQRVVVDGSKEQDTSVHDLFATASATTSSGKVRSYLFLSEEKPPTPLQESSWIRINKHDVDALVVATYCEGRSESGDWMQVQVPKYLAPYGTASLAFGIVSPRALVRPTFWELRRAHAAGDSLPVVFRDLSRGTVIPSATGLAARLGLWFQRLDALQSKAPQHDGQQFVGELLARFGVQTFADLKRIVQTADQHGTKGWYAAAYQSDGVQNAVAATYEWSEKKPEPSATALTR